MPGASSSTASNIYANRVFFNRAHILDLKTRNLKQDNDTPEPPLGPNEYDYIIIGTGAGGAGVLLGLLEKGKGNEKILVIDKGNTNTLSFDDKFNNNKGYTPYDKGTTNAKLRNKDIITVDTQPENIKQLDGTVLENQVYPIIIANTIGGNTSNNAGFWHHQPLSTIASFPPNNLNNFDINKWEEYTKLSTSKLTNFDRGEYYQNSVSNDTTVFGTSRIAQMKEKYDNFLSTRFTNAIKKFINRFGFTIPFNDSNLERNENKLITVTNVYNEGKMGMVAPILRVFNDYNIIYNADIEEFNNENVKVITNSDVEKILLNTDFTEAYGVNVNNKNGNIEYKARHKVFVCCGAFDTPKLLAKSNLGKRSWYSNNNSTNPNNELQDRLDTMGKLWQTPDFKFWSVAWKIDENENEGFKCLNGDYSNINDQILIFDNVKPPVQFGSVPFTWIGLWETLRTSPILGLKGVDILEDYYLFLKFQEDNKMLSFNLSIKAHMQNNGYTEEQINKVEEGISNFDINNLTFATISGLTQYRVYDNKVEYPGGSLDFNTDKFDYENLKADFGWENLQTNNSFRTSVQQQIDALRNSTIPAMFENGSAFSSYNEIIDNALALNRFDLLVTGIMAVYSTTLAGLPVVVPPLTYTDNTNVERTVYIDDSLKAATPDEYKATLSSGWHYTGTCFDISDKETGEVVPGLMIADGSSMNGPVKNNSMASISAVGIYMATLALENKKK